MTVKSDRERWTFGQAILVAIVLALLVVLVGLAALGLGWVRFAASPAPSATPNPTARATLTQATQATASAAQAICEAFDQLWDIQTNHVIPIGTRLLDWLPGGTIDVEATYRDARAVGEGSVAAGAKIATITFARDPALVVSLKQSVAGYAQGSVSLKTWLDAGDFESRASYVVGDALQQLAEGANALGDANLGVGMLHATGTLTCDARY